MTPTVGDTVSWLVAVCPRMADDGPPDEPIPVHFHRRYGRVVEVLSVGSPRGVLAEPLPLDRPDRDTVWRVREFYVSLQPGGELPVWPCDGQYRTEDR